VRGTVDAALTLGPLGLPGLLGRVLRTEPLIAAVPASSPLAMRQRLNRADLVGALTVRFPSSADDRWRHFWEVDHASRRTPRASIEECLHAVVWGGAVTLAPRSVATAHPSADIRFVDLDGNEQVDLLPSGEGCPRARFWSHTRPRYLRRNCKRISSHKMCEHPARPRCEDPRRDMRRLGHCADWRGDVPGREGRRESRVLRVGRGPQA
jgi:hypothetical protein